MTTNMNFSSLTQGTIIGDLLVIGAGVIWAIFMIYNKPLVKDNMNLIQSMALLLFFTLLPLLLPASFSAGTFVSLPWDAWLAIFTPRFCAGWFPITCG